MRHFKGGGSSGPTETTVTNTDLPEYVQPYFERILKRGEAESNQPYTPYEGDRLAYFSPDEMAAQGMTRGYAQAGTPQEYQLASQRAAQLGGPYGSQYQAGQYGSGYQAGQQLPGYDAQTYQPGYQAQGIKSGYQAQDNFSTYDPNSRQSGYQAGNVGQGYTPLGYEENIQRFMSPFQQNVTDVQKREATRQSEMMGDKTADAATMSGGLGGYREAIMQSERERNLGTQLDDIQSRGSQAAFQSAQQQLAAERTSGLDASRFGLQQFSAGEQARQSQEQMQQQAFQVSEQARASAAKMGMDARQQNQAARQAEEQYRQKAFQQTEAGRQAQEKFGQSGFQLTEGSFQKQADMDLNRFKAGEAAKQAAAKLGLTAAQQNEAARQAQEKFGQSAYDMSQKSGIASVNALGEAGGNIQKDALSRISALQGVGSQQRAMQQASMDMGYQDFLRQQGYSMQQISNMAGLLRGVPVQPNQQVSTYSQQPGLFQTAVGAGLQGLGLYKGMS